jgi:hypothetical protein
MNLTQLYAFCIGCVFALLVLYHSFMLALDLVRRQAIILITACHGR